MRTWKGPNKRNWGLLKRREIFLPTLRGWLTVLLLGASLMIVVANEIHPFLATTSPVSGGDLIVEGWVPDYALEIAKSEFKRIPYRTMYVTGGPIGKGASLCGYATYAELGAATLRSKGLPASLVEAVPAPEVGRDRTYTSAVALRKWQQAHGIVPGSYHVMTIGPHARRTRLLFEEALGDGAVVGITAIDDPSYDSKHWWNSSEGVRTVVGESIAYVYARLLPRQSTQ